MTALAVQASELDAEVGVRRGLGLDEYLYIGEVNVGQRYYRYVYTGMAKPENPGYSVVSPNP